MTRLIKAIALSFMLALSFSANPAFADLDQAEKAEVRALIKAYLIENPDLIRDVLNDLILREQREELENALAIARDDAADGLMGNPDADVTIYEFSDYNCGYCKRIFNDLRTVLGEDPNLAVRVKEFPILSESSVIAARAGLAAQRQGKFEAFHIVMMESVGGISENTIQDAAKRAGLDMTQFSRDRVDPSLDNVLATNTTLARQLKITGTPGLIIGDTVIPGAISADQIRELVAVARANKNS